MEILKDSWVDTPRFMKVKIVDVYESRKDAYADGYTEPTHYNNPEYGILGKNTSVNHMIFAAYKK